MGNQKVFESGTHLDWMNSGSITQVLYLKMLLFVRFCWYCMSATLFGIFGFLSRSFFRLQFRNSIKKDESQGELEEKRFHDQTPEDTQHDGFGEKESCSGFSFKFQFRSQEEIRRIVEESEARLSEENKSSFKSTPQTHDDHSFSEKDFAGFSDEQEVISFSIKESSIDSEGDTPSRTKETPDIEFEDGFLSDREIKKENSAREEAPAEEPVKNSGDADGCKTEQPGASEANPEVNFGTEKEFSGFDSDPESISLSDGLSVMNPITESDRNEFPSDNDFGRLERRVELQEQRQNSEVSRWWESFVSDTESVDFSGGFSPINRPIDICKLYISDSESLDFSEPSSAYANWCAGSVLSAEFLSEKDFPGSETDTDDFDVEVEEIEDELRESEETHLENSQIPVADEATVEKETSNPNQSAGFLSEEDFDAPERELQEEDRRTNGSANELCELVETQIQDSDDSDPEDEDGLEYLWEHQDLLEQLKMEIKKVRETGLPTILEESEDMKMIDDLKPWKIDEKFLQEDPLDEMQKFYKSYRERMRKLDILNYQKMYAIGFLQLKDPLESISISSRKSSTPKLSSLLALRRYRRRSDPADPTAKFIQELQSDLETVYVGQTCLSWEFLHWQFEKSHELSESDPHSCRHYNQAAGEFQQFQVLLQRFLENEPFQGPRVQNYVQTRCVLKNLLQVPEIKEDCLKERMEEKKKGNGAVTSEMLMTIIDETMRIFWLFVKADKEESNAILKESSSRIKSRLEDAADFKLFEEVQAELLKREKKLKELLRMGNCLVKKFQKARGDPRSHRAFFFAQVDLRLVSRVLRMSRITSDQLLWCHKKLDKVAFHDRKLHREPSFLPFPCC